MKIAVYYDLPYGGAHVVMEEILKRLRKRHEIKTFHVQSVTEFPKLFNRLWLDVESIWLQRGRHQRLAWEIDSEKFDLVFVSHDRHFQAPWLLRFLKTPSVFLCQEPTRSFFEAFLGISPDLPILNRIYEKINRSIRKNIEIKNASFASRIISNSLYSSESIFRAYGKISTPIYLGLNKNDFYSENLNKANQVLIVGNHEPQKALSFAIECIALIEKKCRPKLVIISPRHRPNHDLVRLAKKFHVVLEIHENISTPKLRNLYNRSKISLALAHLEPFGLSVIESLACGTPVLAVNEGGFREIIHTDKTGILVSRDRTAVSDAITDILQNDTKRTKLAENGVADIKKRFDWNLTLAKIENIFYEVT